MEGEDNKFVFVVGDEQIIVEKHKLAQKIKHFETLFSGNYSDSNSNEYKTSHWSSRSIKDLVEWINDKEGCQNLQKKFTQSSVTKSNVEAANQLIDFLDIANYFLIDELQNELIQVILKYALLPENAILFYTYAKNHPFLKDVQDAAFAICIEHFSKLPIEQLANLPSEIFFSIVGNMNLQCQDKNHLKNAMESWYKINSGNLDISKEDFRKITTATVEEIRNLKEVQYHIFDDHDHPDLSDRKMAVIEWDGTSFSRFNLELPFTWTNKEFLIGAQFVAKGFDLYLVGGKFGLGNGAFNSEIWRYSLLTKKWYYVTSLKEPLRHMSVVFWKNRLYVIGGTGRFRIKNETMRYYDLDRKEWSKPLGINENLVQNVQTCVHDNKIIIAGPVFFEYDPETSKLKQIHLSKDFEKIAIDGILQAIYSDEQLLYCAVECDDLPIKIYALNTLDGTVKLMKSDTLTRFLRHFQIVATYCPHVFHIVVSKNYTIPTDEPYCFENVNYRSSCVWAMGRLKIKKPWSLYENVATLTSLYEKITKVLCTQENLS